MNEYIVYGFSGNPCKYKMVSKKVNAENLYKAIKKSRIRNVTQVVKL